MGRYDDWPKSPIRAATTPNQPIYVTVPFWRGQLPTMSKIADHLIIATPDLVTFAALSFVTSFASREALFAALKHAQEVYGVKGLPPKLAFPLEWTDSPWGRQNAKLERRGGIV